MKTCLLYFTTAMAIVASSAAYAQEEKHSTQGQEDTTWSMPLACEQAPASGSDQSDSEQSEDNVAESDSGDGAPVFVRQYMAELQEMQENFPDDPAGDPDVDFVRRVIPHHQGLLELSQVYLEHSEDEMIQKMAELFIVSQRGQIATLCDWLSKHRS